MLASHALLRARRAAESRAARIRAIREERYGLLRGFFHGATDDADAAENLQPRLHTVLLTERAHAVGRSLDELGVDGWSRSPACAAAARARSRARTPTGASRPATRRAARAARRTSAAPRSGCSTASERARARRGRCTARPVATGATASFPGFRGQRLQSAFRISRPPDAPSSTRRRLADVPDRNAVELTDVSFGYDRRRPVLRGIDMTIPRGKVVAIMGGSGCGKTTILRLIGGQLRPQRGTRHASTARTSRRSTATALFALRRKMGMLFQFGALFTDLTVFENIAFPLREHTDLPEELIRDLVLMKLQRGRPARRARSCMPAELSGGMARRVALARAIALDPMLIMYDEPFAGLDPISLGVVGAADPQAERRARRHLDRRHARRLRVAEDRRLRLLRRRGPHRRAGHAGRGARVERSVRAPVRRRRARRPGAVPLSGAGAAPRSSRVRG